MGNPKFNALLRQMQEMHDRKASDYSTDQDRYSNFRVAGMIAAPFSDPIDIAFATLIGVKLARLQELKGKGKVPKNESIQDTFLDLAVYASLWASYYAEATMVSEASGQAGWLAPSAVQVGRVTRG